jgi:nucleoside-diphosphate-sugar epimerase
MTKEKIFITGATGCVGHYVMDEYLDNPDFELHLLLRDPARIRFDYKKYPNVHLHIGNMEFIEEQEEVIRGMNYLIHIATDWSNSDYAVLLNVEKTHKMFSYCDPEKLKKIVYFSTASILGKNNKPIKEAELYGPGYVRSKYLAFDALGKLPISEKVVTLFPTLVFGGDEKHPFSHITSGIKPNLNYLKILRFFYIDAAFHFLHSKDIAAVTKYVMLNDVEKKEYVLGNSVVTGKEVIKELCKVFDVRIYFRIKVITSFVFWLAKIFKIEIDPWTRHCIENPFFEYDVVNPSSFGLETKFPNLKALLEDVKVCT